MEKVEVKQSDKCDKCDKSLEGFRSVVHGDTLCADCVKSLKRKSNKENNEFMKTAKRFAKSFIKSDYWWTNIVFKMSTGRVYTDGKIIMSESLNFKRDGERFAVNETRYLGDWEISDNYPHFEKVYSIVRQEPIARITFGKDFYKGLSSVFPSTSKKANDYQVRVLPWTTLIVNPKEAEECRFMDVNIEGLSGMLVLNYWYIYWMQPESVYVYDLKTKPVRLVGSYRKGLNNLYTLLMSINDTTNEIPKNWNCGFSIPEWAKENEKRISETT